MCKHLEALITATLLCIHALPYAIMCRDMPCNMLMLWGRGGGRFEIPNLRPMGLMSTFIITSVQYYRLNNHYNAIIDQYMYTHACNNIYYIHGIFTSL